LLICISIVSHGQGHLVSRLLDDLETNSSFQTFNSQIIVTLNIFEDEGFLENRSLNIRVLRNTRKLGFGANHNQAFEFKKGEIFIVLNPDIRILKEFSFREVIHLFDKNDGVVSPVILNNNGIVEDNARRFPTFLSTSERILTRIFGFKVRRDYKEFIDTIEVDWLGGMFMIFRSDAFEQVKGFDTRYFMYLEDADICRRLAKHGWKRKLLATQSAIHEGQRMSHRNLQHFLWHIRSLWRFLLQSAG
jgi:N-acetylglucosaminyl-diphospho-decaprenol L-rhamnosyltransferase